MVFVPLLVCNLMELKHRERVQPLYNQDKYILSIPQTGEKMSRTFIILNMGNITYPYLDVLLKIKNKFPEEYRGL